MSPLRILSQFLISLLMLLSFKLTNFPKDFLALVFFIFSPNARDVKALSAAFFSFDPERFTSFNPSEMSDASALRVDNSFGSSRVLSNPWFASIFLVLGLFASVATTVAFFLGLEGSVSFALFSYAFLGCPVFKSIAHA